MHEGKIVSGEGKATALKRVEMDGARDSGSDSTTAARQSGFSTSECCNELDDHGGPLLTELIDWLAWRWSFGVDSFIFWPAAEPTGQLQRFAEEFALEGCRAVARQRTL
jgi:hypothetical protein